MSPSSSSFIYVSERRLFNVAISLFVREKEPVSALILPVLLKVIEVVYASKGHHGNQAGPLNPGVLDSSPFLRGRPSLAALLAAAPRGALAH